MPTIPPLILPFVTTSIGLGGLTIGFYYFLNPIAAARIYGVPVIPPPSASSSLTSPLSPSPPASSQKVSRNLNGRATFTDTDTSYIHALGIRNLTAGLSIIAVTGYWHITLSDASPAIRLAVQRALGIVILVGSLVPIVDAWVCWSRASALTPSRPATAEKSEGRGKGGGDGGEILHADADADANTDARAFAAEIGRRAGKLHTTRSLVWVAGGLWCLFG